MPAKISSCLLLRKMFSVHFSCPMFLLQNIKNYLVIINYVRRPLGGGGVAINFNDYGHIILIFQM